MFLVIPLQVLSSKLHFREDIFIRICLRTHRKGTVNQLNPAYSHSAHSHIYSKSTHSSVVARLSFYWSLGLHCVAKWIPLSRDPACHSTNNKSNKHRQRPVCFFFFHFWMQTLWVWIYSLHQSCGTNSVCMKCYCMIPTTNSDKAWKDIAFLFFFCSTASPFMFFFFFFVMPRLFPNRNTTAWGSGAQGWHCTAAHDAHETILWNYFTHLSKRVAQW